MHKRIFQAAGALACISIGVFFARQPDIGRVAYQVAAVIGAGLLLLWLKTVGFLGLLGRASSRLWALRCACEAFRAEYRRAYLESQASIAEIESRRRQQWIEGEAA